MIDLLEVILLRIDLCLGLTLINLLFCIKNLHEQAKLQKFFNYEFVISAKMLIFLLTILDLKYFGKCW